MFYVPCIAIIAALAREFGWKAMLIIIFEIAFAINQGWSCTSTINVSHITSEFIKIVKTAD